MRPQGASPGRRWALEGSGCGSGGILGMSSGRGQVWVEEGIKLGCISADLRVL